MTDHDDGHDHNDGNIDDGNDDPVSTVLCTVSRT